MNIADCIDFTIINTLRPLSLEEWLIQAEVEYKNWNHIYQFDLEIAMIRVNYLLGVNTVKNIKEYFFLYKVLNSTAKAIEIFLQRTEKICSLEEIGEGIIGWNYHLDPVESMKTTQGFIEISILQTSLELASNVVCLNDGSFIHITMIDDCYQYLTKDSNWIGPFCNFYNDPIFYGGLELWSFFVYLNERISFVLSDKKYKDLLQDDSFRDEIIKRFIAANKVFISGNKVFPVI